MNFRMKNQGVKREERISFFVNSTWTIKVFYTVIYTMTTKYLQVYKKALNEKKCLHLFNKKKSLYGGHGSEKQNL